MNDKDRIQTKIRNLQTEDEALCVRKEAIRDKHDRPTQWMKDPDWKAIVRGRQAIAEELDDFHKLLNEIEDEEWAARMATAYPDGQV